MKRPAFQFYPADWRKDAALQGCSISARGLWHEMLCIAHECTPYGYMIVNGKALSDAQIARLTGITPRECSKLLDELGSAGVFSRSDDGAIYSRRMVRDEYIRAIRAEAGKQGGNPNLVGNKVKQLDNQTLDLLDNQTSNQSPTPSSSSSSSSKPKPSSTRVDPHSMGFARFWSAYPQTARKVGKADCEKKWRRDKLDAVVESILAHVEAMKTTRQWRDGYEPAPKTYLNGRRWEDGLPGDAGGASDGFSDNPFAVGK